MNSKQRIGLAIGGGILAVAAAVGVGAVAANYADPGNGPADRAGAAGNGPGAGRDGRMVDTTALATRLAARLGVDEAKVKAALDNAMKAAQPSGAPSGGFSGGGTPGEGPSSGTWRTQRLTTMAASIATELNLDQAKVLAALQEVMGSRVAAQPGSQPTK